MMMLFAFMDMPAGEYDFQIGIIDLLTNKAKIKLAIEEKTPDGLCNHGKIIVQ